MAGDFLCPDLSGFFCLERRHDLWKANCRSTEEYRRKRSGSWPVAWSTGRYNTIGLFRRCHHIESYILRILEKTGDAENLKEELGDLLLQVVMHARIAEEEGLFSMEDICRMHLRKHRSWLKQLAGERKTSRNNAEAFSMWTLGSGNAIFPYRYFWQRNQQILSWISW